MASHGLYSDINGTIESLEEAELIKVVRDKLEEQEELLKAVLETTHKGFVVVDSEGGLYYANDAYCELTGRAREELLEYGWKIAVAPEDQKLEAEVIRRIEEGLSGHEARYVHYIRPDGTVRHTRRSCRPISWAGKNRALVSMSDITELKKAQAMLEEEAAYRHEVFESAFNGMAVVDPLTLRHFEVNGAYAELLGYAKESLLDPGFNFLDTFAPEEIPKVLDALQTVRATKAPFRLEVTHLRRDAEHRHVLAQVSFLTRRKGWESERCLVVLSDISDIKHQSEFLQGMTDISPVGLFTCDIETGAILDANPAFLTMLGYSKEELLGKTWYEIIPPQVVQQELEENEALLKGDISMIRREKTFITKDGTELPVVLYFGKLFDPRVGKEVYIDFAADVSELKKAQKRLDEAYHYFYEVFDQTNEMLVVFDSKGGILEVNQALEALKKVFRAEDVIARLGGDEFAALLVGANGETFKGVLVRIGEAIARENETRPEPRLSLSAGFAFAPQAPFQHEALFQAADRAMYQDKIARKRAGGKG